jgi:hypothetical protein
MSDNKENKWAKVLSDAGLLDDVADAWELPSDDTVHNGTVIEVTPKKEPDDVIPEESFINIASETDVSQKDEDATVRVPVYDEHQKAENPFARNSRMPFSPVQPADEPRPASKRSASGYAPPEKIDTQPAPMAKHSMASMAQSDEQPEFAVLSGASPKDDESTAQRLKTAKNTVPERISVVKVGDADISVAAYDSNAEIENVLGSIVDEPVTEQISGQKVSITPEKPDIREEMKQKYNLGDFSGALELAEEILAFDASSLDAVQYRKSCQERLLQMYMSKIGDLSNVPQLQVSNHELMWRNLDATAGFVLSRVDGISSYDNILDISGLATFDTCRILYQLLQDGLIMHY